MKRTAAIALVLAAGCAGAEPGDESPRASRFTGVPSGALNDRHQTGDLRYAVPPGATGVALRLTTNADACVQIDRFENGDGTTWIEAGDRGEAGPYCEACMQRAHEAHGYGLFVLPNDGGEARAAGTVTFRASLRDCDGHGPAALDAPAGLSAEAVPVFPDDGGPRRLAVALAGPADTPWGPVLARVNDIFRPAGVSVEACATASVPRLDLRVAAASPGALDDAVAGLDFAGCDAAATVAVARCIVYGEGVRATRLTGYAPRIPGGFPSPGRFDGVAVSDGTCDGGPGLAPHELAANVAHELGHYLGLYHSEEYDGRADHLADAPAADNLMQAGGALTPTWTAHQRRVVRMHPALRR